MKKTTTTLLLLSVMFSGCATIMHGGSDQTIGIATNPVGATVTIEGQKYTSPARMNIKRNQSYTGIVEMEGYETASFTITKKVSGWVWGNIAFGGIIGLIVDFASGSVYKLSPDNITVDLKRKL